MKKLFFISAFLMLTVLSFSQGKGKSKAKTNSKAQTTVPPPQGNPSKLPEVKEKPQVYQQNDSTKNPKGQQDKGEGKEKNKKGYNGKDSSGYDNSNKENWNKDKKQHEGEHEDGDNESKGKEKVKYKNGKENSEADDDHESDEKHSKDKWKEKNKENGNGNSKVRTNIPTQVRNSFNTDYPNASDTVWTKQQGDWTVNFRNNAFRSTATYHSNGERLDTRTNMPSQQAPAPVLGEIQKRFPQANPKDIIKIEKPKNPNLFQVMINEGGKLKAILFDEKGKLVSEQ